MSITILELAVYRLGVEDADQLTAGDFQRANLDILGGCEICHASIAAFTAYPSRSGFWRCQDCLGGDGYDTVGEANRAICGDDLITVETGAGSTYKALLLAVREKGGAKQVRVLPRGGRDAVWVALGDVLEAREVA
jgi:hypothetical protein